MSLLSVLKQNVTESHWSNLAILEIEVRSPALEEIDATYVVLKDNNNNKQFQLHLDLQKT